MDKYGSFMELVQFLESPVEGQERGGLTGDSVIRPGHVVELSHIQRPLRPPLQLGVSGTIIHK